ncbi:hypothetical protein [Actinoplanes philippinensis]|nr:hypothetical protein [Actinoplanes philippinensis]
MRELLEAAYAGEPPMRHSTDDFVAGGRTRRARRRASWAAGAATAMLAVVGVTVMPQIIAGNRSVPASGQDAMRYPASAFEYTVTGYTVGDIEVSDPVNVTPGYQQSRIRRTGDDRRYNRGDGTFQQVEVSASVLVVYRAGVFDANVVGGGEPVQIGGVTGRYLPGGVLAWPYAPDSWAVIHSGNGHLSRADMTRVAERLPAGPSRPAALPWRMTYLPPGYQLSSMGITSDDEVTGAHLQRGDARFTRQAESYAGLADPLTGEGLDNLRIKVFPRWYGENQLSIIFGGTSVEPNAGASGGPSHDPSGEPSYDPSSGPSNWPSYDPSAGVSNWPTSDPSAQPPLVDPFCAPGQGRCFRYTADGAYLVEATASAPEPDAELVQVLRGLRLADPDDTGTWSELSEALPGPVR